MRWNKITMLLCLGLVFASFSVMAANQNVTQENITTSLTVYSFPSIGTVLLEDSDTNVVDELDPAPGSTFSVNCTATVTDADGDSDITSANATLYLTSTGHAAADDNQNHYTDSSCTIDAGASDNDADVTCEFTVQFYATPGSWTCNMTVADALSQEDSDATETSVMTDLLALDVDVASLDFGSLALDADTGSVDNETVVSNNGNVNLNVSLNTYGAVFTDTEAMDCSTGTIASTYLKYDTSASTAYAGKTSIIADGGIGPDTGLTINAQTSGTSGTTGSLYFGMGVPSSGVAGSCTGTLMFTAVEV